MSALGFNTGYIEELYSQYLIDPQSVSESWQEFFADYQPSESFVAVQTARSFQVASPKPVSAAAEPALAPVSYTHLTLPTNREV